jgi:hypothetical protein
VTDTQKKALLGILVAAVIAALKVFGVDIPILPGI